jgi:cytosine/adenosine deaminase-related metal-dependent hydrolase
MSFDLGGPLAEFLAEINADLFLYNGTTPVDHVIENICSLDDRWLLVHLNEVLDSDLDALARQPTKSHVVHCPRSHQYFGHSPFQYDALQLRGLKICLGTDSLASNNDLSLFGEMRAFQSAFPSVPPLTILRMVTVDAAVGLRQAGRLGILRRGAYADIIAITMDGSSKDLFDKMIAFEGEPWVMIGGEFGTL